MTVEDQIVEGAAKLGISQKDLERLRERYEADHGDDADQELAAYLRRSWRLRDPVRIPARQNGVKLGEQYVSGRGGGLADEPEAVSKGYQDDLSDRARDQLAAARQDEFERRELRQLASRAKDLAKRCPKGTNFRPHLDRIRAQLDDLERWAKAV